VYDVLAIVPFPDWLMMCFVLITDASNNRKGRRDIIDIVSMTVAKFAIGGKFIIFDFNRAY
jgi:hypothetical protein